MAGKMTWFFVAAVAGWLLAQYIRMFEIIAG